MILRRKTIIRLNAVLLAAVLALSLSACSAKKKDDGTAGGDRAAGTDSKGTKSEVPGGANEAGGFDSGDDWEDEWDHDDMDDEGDGSGDSLSASYKEDEYGNYRGTEVPRGFPADILPIYKDSVILGAMKDNMGVLFTRYIVNICTVEPYEKVAEYYNGVLSGLQGFEEAAREGYYTFKTETGVEKDYEVSVIDQTLGYYDSQGLPENAKTVIMLMCNEYKELPKEYRADLVPVMQGSVPLQSSIGANLDGHLIYDFTFDTRKGFQDIVAFYREVMSNAGSYQEETQPGDDGYLVITGTMEHYEIGIYISDVMSGTIYNIQMTDVEYNP